MCVCMCLLSRTRISVPSTRSASPSCRMISSWLVASEVSTRRAIARRRVSRPCRLRTSSIAAHPCSPFFPLLLLRPKPSSPQLSPNSHPCAPPVCLSLVPPASYVCAVQLSSSTHTKTVGSSFKQSSSSFDSAAAAAAAAACEARREHTHTHTHTHPDHRSLSLSLSHTHTPI